MATVTPAAVVTVGEVLAMEVVENGNFPLFSKNNLKSNFKFCNRRVR